MQYARSPKMCALNLVKRYGRVEAVRTVSLKVYEGVPSSVLPAWAQKIAGFIPGRCAVDIRQRSFGDLRVMRVWRQSYEILRP
jgi:hypothetical protein